MSDTPMFALRLDAEDRALLAALARAEKDTMSNVVRRLVRERCKRRGIEAETAKPNKGKR